MLRLYKPINHNIFKLHEMLEHLVCSVWCEAEDQLNCDSLLRSDFKLLLPYKVNKDYTLEQKVNDIYEKFIGLSPVEKQKIRQAFRINNEIEKLCDKSIEPIYLNDLAPVVDQDIKPLFEWFYNELLDKGKVSGDKLSYYKELIRKSDFQYCPCCGLIDFESPVPENEVREANDHYLPKSKFPFASVNFKNLVPLCYKCNSDRKSTKDPIENSRKVFYPFDRGAHNISITLQIDKTKDIDKLDRTDLKVILTGDAEKIETWDWLFDISNRYNDTVREKIAFNLVRQLANRYKRSKDRKQGLSFTQIIDDHIQDYHFDKYSDKKFLKIPFLEDLKNFSDLIAVYE